MKYFCTLVAACALLGTTAHAEDKTNEEAPIVVPTKLSGKLSLGKIIPVYTQVELPDGHFRTTSSMTVELLNQENPKQIITISATMTSMSLSKEVEATFLNKSLVRLEKTKQGHTVFFPKSSPGSSADYFAWDRQEFAMQPPVRDGETYQVQVASQLEFTDLRHQVSVRVEDTVFCRITTQEERPCGLKKSDYLELSSPSAKQAFVTET